MTAADWTRETDPYKLVNEVGVRASDRQMRLLAIGCVRRLWHLLSPTGRHCIEGAEQFIAGELNKSGLHRLYSDRDEVVAWASKPKEQAQLAADLAACFACNPSQLTRKYRAHGKPNRDWEYGVMWPLDVAAEAAALCDYPQHDSAFSGALVRHRQEQCRHIREVFAPPMQQRGVEASWLIWQDCTIPRLALAAFEKRELPSGHLDRECLALLADALEDAGCNDNEVLVHLRSSESHFHGCWVVDLVRNCS